MAGAVPGGVGAGGVHRFRRRIRATLRVALNKAIKQRLIEVNVAALVELPSGKAPKALVWTEERIARWERDFADHITKMNAGRRRQAELEPDKRIGNQINRLDAYIGAPRPSRVMVWTPALTKRFLNRTGGHRLHAQYYLIAFRGLRRGESCGLRWTDLDLKNKTAAIAWQITQIGPEIFEGKPRPRLGKRPSAWTSPPSRCSARTRCGRTPNGWPPGAPGSGPARSSPPKPGSHSTPTTSPTSSSNCAWRQVYRRTDCTT